MTHQGTPFGQLDDGRSVGLFTLKNAHGMQVEMMEWGSTIWKILLPQPEGPPVDVVLGYDSLAGYQENPLFFGAVIGRNSNRLGGGRIQLGNLTYDLEKNAYPHNLHSGSHGLHRRLFSGEQVAEDMVEFSATVPHLADDFPGTLRVKVRYRLTRDNALHIEYRAVSDQQTVINLTNHSYFNLAGHQTGHLQGHFLQLDAPFYAKSDDSALPTGEVACVGGTPLDFTHGADLHAATTQLTPETRALGGLDHNLIFACQTHRPVGTLTHRPSGRHMKIFTTEPCVQLYAGGHVDSPKGNKEGAVYGKHSAVCLETQNFPNAPHLPWLRSPIYQGGQPYTSETIYQFFF